MDMSLVPYVIEQTGKGERSYDIFSRLLEDRIIMLHDQVNDTTASLIIAQMLYLEGKDPEKDIHFYIYFMFFFILCGRGCNGRLMFIKYYFPSVMIDILCRLYPVILTE